ncbi:MAG: hypothetical protein KAJ07_08980 [Planctomycetes bacterium]|nr:hypothetical protein [Planctomycetota bacterium]
MKQIRNSLGIVFYGQTIAVSEVKSVGNSCQVRCCAEFTMPDGVTIENIASQQAKFGDFLKENGFKSKRAVIGISAKQIVSTSLKIPPIEDADTRQQTIKIQLERELNVDFSDIVFDCWDSHCKNDETILTMMTLKKTVEATKEFLAAFKITPLSITGSSMGLDLEARPGIDCNIVNYPGSLEVFIFQDRSLKTIVNISKKAKDSFDAEQAADVCRQIDRTLWLLSTKDSRINYTLWTTDSDTDEVGKHLCEEIDGLRVEDIKPPPEAVSCGYLCDLASHLAGRVISGEPARVNFLNGHHQTKNITIPKHWWSRIAIGIMMLFLLLGLYFYSWYVDLTEIARYQQSLDSMSTSVLDAEKMAVRVAHARQWFDREPMHLDNLRELTMAFPETSDIWLTSLAVDASLNQVIAGRASNEDAILDVVDKLKANPLFKDIKLLYIRKMGKNTEVMTFAINFNCRREQ